MWLRENYVAALFAPGGRPARVLAGWSQGRFGAIVSPGLVGELERMLRRPKFRRSIRAVQIEALLSALVASPSRAAGAKCVSPATRTSPG